MFDQFKQVVARQFEEMKGHQLYRTDVEKDLLWLTYLESFPDGANPMFRERTAHDCSACRQFIKAVGSMIAIIDGERVSLWDCEPPPPYDVVASALAELVKAAPIRNVLLHDQSHVGVDKNHQEASDGTILTWEHFHVVLPQSCVSQDRGSVYGEKRSTMEVFRRALEEITAEAVETVIELIDQGSLYRGEEHLATVKEFAAQRGAYHMGDDPRFAPALEGRRLRELFVWKQGLPPAVAHIRNSAIGTLLVDLSEGKGLDEAVRSFESKVAPQNYKRPKALVTKAMIKRARATVKELGYAASLGRRFALIDDISVNNVLFANRDARRAMSTDVFDDMLAEARDDPKSLEKVEDVPIETFVESILPRATSIELLFENRHSGNLVNLVAPQDPFAPSILKWDNNFTWSYHGDLADSIRERVKARGGSVTGDFRASLAWFNSDDLDLHLVEPRPGEHIHYNNKRSRRSDGQLDVDMNVTAGGSNFSRNAVENITYPRRSRMLEGDYHLYVHNYTHREHVDVGFEVEMEFGGETTTFACDREVRQGEKVTVAKFTFSRRHGLKITESLPRQDVSKVLWGLSTQTFHPVTLVMLSPNHWDGRPVGNKHWFFMLQDCRRDGSSRGFFNEQLADDLRDHRKVFECLGSKMRTEDEGPQLSGLGFSSTRRNSVYAKVSGAFTRTINITF
jgi:hypothetical protein